MFLGILQEGKDIRCNDLEMPPHFSKLALRVRIDHIHPVQDNQFHAPPLRSHTSRDLERQRPVAAAKIKYSPWRHQTASRNGAAYHGILKHHRVDTLYVTA